MGIYREGVSLKSGVFGQKALHACIIMVLSILKVKNYASTLLWHNLAYLNWCQLKTKAYRVLLSIFELYKSWMFIFGLQVALIWQVYYTK